MAILVITPVDLIQADSAYVLTPLVGALNGGLGEPGSEETSPRRRRRREDSDDLRLGRVLRYEDRRI